MGLELLSYAPNKVAVAGGEERLTVPVLFQLGSGALHDACRHSAWKDGAAGIIHQPLPCFGVELVPQLLYLHSECPTCHCYCGKQPRQDVPGRRVSNFSTLG